MAKVGIYVRISDDRDGTQTATQRQLEDCRRYAETHNWEVADTFEDVDTSAFKRTTKRPEFERMLGAVQRRDIDGVLAWKVDRIARRGRDLVRLDESCEQVGAFISTVVESIDTRQPTGRFVAELLVAQARMESENTSTRVKRSHAEMAANGRPTIGGTRPFGYTPDRSATVPEEAELIREAASRILAGESLRGIAWDWERRGVKSSAGKPWMPSSLGRMLMNATLSGQREYQGTLVKGTWPAILTPDETTRLRAILGNPSRSAYTGNARKYLLSGGILRCGRCGGAMVGRPFADGRRRYVCSRRPDLPNCGRMAVMGEPVDTLVCEAVFAALDGADLTAYMKREVRDTDAATVDAISVDEAALEGLAQDFYVDQAITRPEFFTARKALQNRLERNRVRLARQQGKAMAVSIMGAGKEVRRQWPDRALDWKRAVIIAVIDRVDILPAMRGRNRFSPERVKVIWRF